jgi:dTMP kinase
MGRARSRGPADRFEVEQLDFFNRVREGFLSIASSSPERVEIVNAGQVLSKVQSDLQTAINSLLNVSNT